jgi:DNA-binding transcriptional regulator of glucitol operon
MTDKIEKLEKATITFLVIAFCAQLVALFSVLMNAIL